jgi:hypothetical protein
MAFSALVAGLAAAAVLYAFGTSSLSFVEWVAGLTGATLAFMAGAVVTRGTSVDELRGLALRLRGAVSRAA